MKRNMESAERMRQDMEKLAADASTARQEADACPGADDSKARNLEKARDILIEICDEDLKNIEKWKEFIANQWQMIQDLEASIPPAA